MYSFDEHIKYLNDKIKENCDSIDDLKEENEDLLKQLETVQEEKENFKEEDYAPSVYLDGWKDTEKKKQLVINWCKQHELKHHSKIIGDYFEDYRLISKNGACRPYYEFVTAISDTSKIRYVRCIKCYKECLISGNVDNSEFECYLPD